MDHLIGIAMIIFMCLFLLVLIYDLVRANDEIRTLKKKVKEMDDRLTVMYTTVTENIERIDKELKLKENRWDVGKNIGTTTVDWDETK